MKTPADFVGALKRGEPLIAVAIARQMLAANALLGDQWRAIGQFAIHVGEWTLALGAMRKLLAASPHDLDRLLAVAETMASAGRPTDAITLCRPYTARFQMDARLFHLLGTLSLELGDTEHGLADLYRAVAIWPHSGMSWLAIAGATDYRADDNAFGRLRAAAPAVSSATPAANAAYCYALGKAQGDRGERDAAFASFAVGARLIRPERPYERSADLAEANALRDRFTRDWLHAAAARNLPAAVDPPILVSGVPRSGTTLVEQILTSHSRVSDGGELNLLGIAAETIIGGAGFEAFGKRLALAGGPEAAWAPLRQRYRYLLSERVGSPGRAVDKSLNTSRLAHVARLALPDSPVIWMRRDPADTAWSCYRTFFAQGLGWSFDLGDLGFHLAVEDLLFAHWKDVFGDQMLVVDYADLVTQPDTWMPRILAHCGLAPEPQVANFHQSERAVRTASVAQVRQPIYSHAVGLAGPQASHLAAFEQSYRATRASLGLTNA
ncbi:MAG TPA: sulfotransferase [Sphingomicrobium sp.]|jgi:tetratricopeptide (TPR) repeat protein